MGRAGEKNQIKIKKGGGFAPAFFVKNY